MALQDRDVAHLLRRVGFGARPAEIEYFRGRELDDVVDEIVNVRADVPPRPDFFAVGVSEWEASQASIEWWVQRMIDSSWVDRTGSTPNPLQEKVALFWHGHFATEMRGVQRAIAMMEQNELFRDTGLDDFEPLCQAVSIGGAMLRYLNNDRNKAGNAQENFARELMELFTMGVGHYTENDVVEMARAWTGHGVEGWNRELQRHDTTYRFRPEWHDNGLKTLFGLPPRNWDGPETITEILQNSRRDETARFIVRKAWKFFASPDPSEATIDQLVEVFKGNGPNGGDLNFGEMLRALFKHPDFWASYRQLIKSPTEFVVDCLRRTQVTIEETSLNWLMGFMGQTLFNPPNVAGWGTNGYWLSSATAWGRARFVNNIRWHAIDDTRRAFEDLRSLTPSQASSVIFEFFGIEQPSDLSRAEVEAWFSEVNVSGSDWSLQRSAVQIGALLPEFQLA